MNFKRLLIAACTAAALLALPNATTIAQEICVEYHLVPRTVFEDKTVTRYRDVVKTVPVSYTHLTLPTIYSV